MLEQKIGENISVCMMNLLHEVSILSSIVIISFVEVDIQIF